ncbi:Uma2 family endonuclease [Raineya sp.]|jgi:Uma2 family endonuclease
MQIETKTSIQDYLLAESQKASKHEYYAGEVIAMAGASPQHNIIVGNLITLLNNCLRFKDCIVFPSDMLLKVPECDSYFYPDVTIVCQKPEYEEHQGLLALLNPSIVIEVLSATTAIRDNNEKLDCYLSLESLEEYHLVDSRKMQIKSYKRNGEDWLLHISQSADEKILFGTCEIALKEVYWKVEFS